jgi:hypothetical protein
LVARHLGTSIAHLATRCALLRALRTSRLLSTHAGCDRLTAAVWVYLSCHNLLRFDDIDWTIYSADSVLRSTHIAYLAPVPYILLFTHVWRFDLLNLCLGQKPSLVFWDTDLKIRSLDYGKRRGFEP